jgi:hypothetical protein
VRKTNYAGLPAAMQGKDSQILREEAKEAIVGSFVALYQAIDEGRDSIRIAIEIAVSPEEQLALRTLILPQDDVLLSACEIWRQTTKNILDGSFDPDELKTEIDTTLTELLGLSA